MTLVFPILLFVNFRCPSGGWEGGGGGYSLKSGTCRENRNVFYFSDLSQTITDDWGRCVFISRECLGWSGMSGTVRKWQNPDGLGFSRHMKTCRLIKIFEFPAV